jgi:hypothetical protein
VRKDSGKGGEEGEPGVALVVGVRERGGAAVARDLGGLVRGG